MVEVRITYETLFDLLRREKSRSELQSLDRGFYGDVIAYLNEKKGTLREEDSHATTISRSEQEKIRIQIKNIQKILRELYELREKKVINLAINRVRTESDLIDRSNFLAEELSLYNEVCELLSKYKSGVLDHVLRMESPSIELKRTAEDDARAGREAFITDRPAKQARRDASKYDAGEEENYPDEKGKYSGLNDETPRTSEEKKQEITLTNDVSGESVPGNDEKLVRVRVLNDLPKFLGQDRNIYGPYKKDDLVEMPVSLTNILLKKGRIELLE